MFIAGFSRSQLHSQAEQSIQQSADLTVAGRTSHIITSVSPHVSLASTVGLSEPLLTASPSDTQSGRAQAVLGPPQQTSSPSQSIFARLWRGSVPESGSGQAADAADSSPPAGSSPDRPSRPATPSTPVSTLRTALGVFERLAAEQKGSGSGTQPFQHTDPLSIAAQELMKRDSLVSQSSAVFNAVLDELSEEQDQQGGLVVDLQHLYLTTGSRNMVRGVICEPAKVGSAAAKFIFAL